MNSSCEIPSIINQEVILDILASELVDKAIHYSLSDYYDEVAGLVVQQAIEKSVVDLRCSIFTTSIILQDSAIDLAEPRSVPALSPGFDLSQFCWCDEGWYCMCGLPDGP